MSAHPCRWNCGGTDCPAPRKPYSPEFSALVSKAAAIVAIKRQPFFMPARVGQ